MANFYDNKKFLDFFVDLLDKHTDKTVDDISDDLKLLGDDPIYDGIDIDHILGKKL